jgi:hypothetical protein
VTITFLVNDHALESIRYTEPGLKHFEKPVPEEWIPAEHESFAGAEIDRTWSGGGDGVKLGFILVRMGLTQQ